MKKQQIKRYKLQAKNGYTLIEALVAITIIVFATVGPLTLAAKSLAESQFVRDQITAFYLAQEGLEVVHHIRDASGPGTSWLSVAVPCASRTAAPIPLRSVISGSIEFDVDARCLDAVPIIDPTRSYLKIYKQGTDPDSGVLYAPVDSSDPNIPDSKFRRVMTMRQVLPDGSSLQNPAEYRVRAKIMWRNGFNDREVVLEESLFDL